MELPEPIAKAMRPLFDALPLERAMTQLVVVEPQPAAILKKAEAVVIHKAIAPHSGLVAGVWLYVDELDRCHRACQQGEDATGAFWHGIMHRREGDFSNSHYWFRRVVDHPALGSLDGYDPHAFIDRVADVYRETHEDLAALQRSEWRALFQWCAHNVNRPPE